VRARLPGCHTCGCVIWLSDYPPLPSCRNLIPWVLSGGPLQPIALATDIMSATADSLDRLTLMLPPSVLNRVTNQGSSISVGGISRNLDLDNLEDQLGLADPSPPATRAAPTESVIANRVAKGEASLPNLLEPGAQQAV
jgi:hypothetical protein